MATLMDKIQPFGTRAKSVEIDVLGPNPAVQYILTAYGPPTSGATPPEMFHVGPKPPFLASGESPALLSKVRFELRHTAAMSESRSVLLACIEVSTSTALHIDPESLVSPAGRAALNDYLTRVWSWATAGPEVQVSFGAEDFDRLFGAEA